MPGRRKHQKKKQKAPHPPAAVNVHHEVLCQEQPGDKENDDMKTVPSNVPNSLPTGIQYLTLLIAGLLLFATSIQACYMRKAMRVDQRAWVSVPIPATFPLDGSFVPINAQIQNGGKTPARGIGGNFVATVLLKGERMEIGKFEVGHAYNKIWGGSVFTGSPIPLSPPLKTYGATPQQIIPVGEGLRQDVANGNKFIIFFGKITYTDIFGIDHWTQFCTGSGSAIDPDSLRQCVTYNDVDPKEE
jgi:hypothetical protein